MAIPSWTDAGLGTMKRAALWLKQEIGEGNEFTKGQLREAFPDTSQIDRRMRDLRDFGWRIDTNREDPSLGAHEQRFVKEGEAVWEPGKATRKTGAAISAAERHAVMLRDNHMCRSCGIGPGETYAGTYMASQLDVARRSVRTLDGKVEVQLVIQCSRCRIGSREHVTDLNEIARRVGRLGAYERRMLASWMAQDSRNFSETEELWALYRAMPADAREEIRAMVTDKGPAALGPGSSN